MAEKSSFYFTFGGKMEEQKSFKERVKETVIQNAYSYKKYFVEYDRQGRWEPGLPSRIGVRERGVWQGWEVTTPPPGRCQEAAASAPTARLVWGLELAVGRGGRAARRG